MRQSKVAGETDETVQAKTKEGQGCNGDKVRYRVRAHLETTGHGEHGVREARISCQEGEDKGLSFLDGSFVPPAFLGLMSGWAGGRLGIYTRGGAGSCTTPSLLRQRPTRIRIRISIPGSHTRRIHSHTPPSHRSACSKSRRTLLPSPHTAMGTTTRTTRPRITRLRTARTASTCPGPFSALNSTISPPVISRRSRQTLPVFLSNTFAADCTPEPESACPPTLLHPAY